MFFLRELWGKQCAGTLLLMLFTFPIVLHCRPTIPGPHFPIAAGAPGDTIINTGTAPRFLSYSAIGEDGINHVFVPVFVAVKTDAGERSFKDIRQNPDKSITIQNPGTFFCAFGHPYRQFAFLDKYKWEIERDNINQYDNRIPVQPLIRSFLVDYDVVKDLMLKATTEPFSDIPGGGILNVDQLATNQFGLSDKYAVMLEKAALPDSLITYAENVDKLQGFTNVMKTWGEVVDVAKLKTQFNVPVDIFPTVESSMFVSIKPKKTDLTKLDLKLATFKEVNAKAKNYDMEEWKIYAGFLKEMESSIEKNTYNNYEKIMMIELSESLMKDYKGSGFDEKVKYYITQQQANYKDHKTVTKVLYSFDLVKKAPDTGNNFLKWNTIVPQLNIKNNLIELKRAFIDQCVNFIADQQDFKGITNLHNQMIKIKDNDKTTTININNLNFPQTLDDSRETLTSVYNFLINENQVENFHNGEGFTKKGLIDYFKSSLITYILSDSCQVSKDYKNYIVQYINSNTITDRNIAYTTDDKGSKIFIGDDGPRSQVLFPDDRLSIEFVDQNPDISKIKLNLNKVFSSTLNISPLKQVTLEFPTTNLNTKSELLWKKHTVVIGDYLKANMKVQTIDLIFRQSKILKYDMISHSIDNGKAKELPMRFENGHLVIDDRICNSIDVKNEMANIYRKQTDSNTFDQFHESKRTDIKFVPNSKGFFLSNKMQRQLENKGVKLDDYKNKYFKQELNNEIIVTITDEHKIKGDQSKGIENTATNKAGKMLFDSYSQKNKDNVLIVSATKDGTLLTVDKNSRTNSDIRKLQNVRITIVGLGDSSSKDGVLKVGGHKPDGLNNLIKEIKTSLRIKNIDLKKVSIVACNPGTSSSKDSANKAVQLAEIIAKQNKVTVTTRTGYVKVDKNGHKLYSEIEDGDYSRRQTGNVYKAVWDQSKLGPIVSKRRAENFLLDPEIDVSDHLGIKTVKAEHMSEIFRDGLSLKKEMLKTVANLDVNTEIKNIGEGAFNSPKTKTYLNKLGNYMSAYGILQTATFLINAEKCEKTSYSSAEACDARKSIAIISLTQEVTEVVHDTYRGMKTMPKITKVGASSFKSFGKSLIRNPLKGLPVLGIGLDAASLGLDIYDLTKAKTPTEKGISGTNVALSSLSLIASATAFTAGLLGATAVAAVAGPAAIVVGVVSFLFNIGVTIWQTKEYEKANIPLVNQAAKYFETMHTLYDNQWYNCRESTLSFTPGIAVKSVDLSNNVMQVYSEYMCETVRSNWKIHVKIYPLLLGSKICGDFDKVESNCYCDDLDCGGIINIRSGMEITDSKLFECNNFKTIIVNTAPIVLRNYTYALFDTHDSVIGLVNRDPQSNFQCSGHYLGRLVHSNNYNFDYTYHFCFDKYAIINNIGFKKYIPSVTEINLADYHVRIVIPNFQNPSFVNLLLTGIKGIAYSVFLSDNCTVKLESKTNIHLNNEEDVAIWKLIMSIELFDIVCDFQTHVRFECAYKFTNIEINNTQNNQVIFVDKNNIFSVPHFHQNKTMFYIVEVKTFNLSSDQHLMDILNPYFSHDFIDLGMTYTPINNLPIKACGYENIIKSHISKLDKMKSKLHFTSELPGHCSAVFNTDSKLHFVKNNIIYFSSSLNSLIWQTHFNNNSLKAFVTLPCHSELVSEVWYSDIEEKQYITQRVNLSNTVQVEAIFRLTETRLFLLSIASEFNVSWADLRQLCFFHRNKIFSNQAKSIINLKTKEIAAGDNDLTFVNTSNTLYWVRKQDGHIVERIFPNIDTHCTSLEITFSNITREFNPESKCADDMDFNANNTSAEVYYFLCMKGKSSQLFVQYGNNQATPIESLKDQEIYIEGNDVLVKNKSNLFSFDNSLPSKMCLFEFRIHLPFDQQDSLESFMVNVSQKYECVESKVKLKFKQLVGLFDFEEMVVVLVHESISSYKLSAVGVTRHLNKYWIWDSLNSTLYLQDTAEASLLLRLVLGNLTEQDYQTMIPIPEKILTNVQEVSYQDGRVYAFTSDGATYYVGDDGQQELLAITDFWLAQHPDADSDLQTETDKEVVMYRPDMTQQQSQSRCKRSSPTDQIHSKTFFLYHIAFKSVFDIDLSDSVFVGSDNINKSVYTYSYQSETLLKTDIYGFVTTDRYALIHRIEDRTLIVESNSMTESPVPPIVDGITTMILSTSVHGFKFDITEMLWYKTDEILLSEDSSKIIVNFDMIPCDYTLEKIGNRVLLIDFAHGKKLVIPNAAKRSENDLIILYVCGEQIRLHHTTIHYLPVVISISSILVLITCVAIFISWRNGKKTKARDENPSINVKSSIDPSPNPNPDPNPNHNPNTDYYSEDSEFIPNEKELQLLLQTPITNDHKEIAIQKATVSHELRMTKFKCPKKDILSRHRILTQPEEESFL